MHTVLLPNGWGAAVTVILLVNYQGDNMNPHNRLLGSVLSASLLSLLAVGGCNTNDSTSVETTTTASEAIIGGVDAKSATLNAVGSLVQVYHYSYYECGWGEAGGSTSIGTGIVTSTATGTGTTTGVGTSITTESDVNSQTGRLDYVVRNRLKSVHSAAGLISAGGTTSIGTTGIAAGGTTSINTSNGGAGGIGEECHLIEFIEYAPFCTGTLIGSSTVMTAEHCLQDLAYLDESEVGFAVGPNAYHPTKVYSIVDYDWESQVPADYSTLFGELGSDVGVVHLSEPVANVTPMAIGTLTVKDVGKRFTALGYGVQDNLENYGTRKAGSVTYRGEGGNYADYAFGGMEDFLDVAPTMPAFSGLSEDELVEIYNALGLVPDYMGFFGGKCGDAQPCYGDSGGPIIGSRDGIKTVLGNITNGFGSSRLVCDYGVVAAIFGPLTKSFLKKSLKWVDPCAGVTSKGYCDGDLAVRCTKRSEGARRLTETDCGILDQTCGVDESGAVACVDPLE